MSPMRQETKEETPSLDSGDCHYWSLDYGSSTGWVKHLIIIDVGGIERIVKMIRHDEAMFASEHVQLQISTNRKILSVDMSS